MQFDIGGVIRNYIQIGTVMTDKEYRDQGLNKKIMESILQEYIDKVDGIYLFGNDSVLNYYPKFGFVPCEEYEYYFAEPDVPNENDAMYMSENLGLYHFWMDSEYRDNIYYLPECGAYVVGVVENDKLYLYQIIGKSMVELEKAAKAFGDGFSEVVLGYTPVHKEGLSVRKHKEEDCTLFIIGQDLRCVSEKQMMFPVLSHA